MKMKKGYKNKNTNIFFFYSELKKKEVKTEVKKHHQLSLNFVFILTVNLAL